MQNTEEKTTGNTFQPRRRHWAFAIVSGIANVLYGVGLKPRKWNAEILMERARRQTGLTDFGSEYVKVPLQCLLDAIWENPDLTPLMRYSVAADTLHSLRSRLSITDYLQHNPAILDIPIRRPMYIVGLPRTGTTLLYNLLGCEANARVMRNFEEQSPLPHPNQIAGNEDLRILQSRRNDRFVDFMSKEAKVIHEAKAEQVGEGFGILKHSFIMWGYLEALHLPNYEEWLWQCDTSTLAKAYEYYQNNLKILMHQNPKDYWILKSPYHMNSMAAIANVHQDVTFVQIHRDLKEQMASHCSQIGVGRNFLTQLSAKDMPGKIGQEIFQFTNRSLQRLLEFRKTWPEKQVIDILYTDLVKDPIGTVKSIFAYLDYPMRTTTEQKMLKWLRDNPKNKHGRHVYQLDQFCLSGDAVDTMGEAYHLRFSVPH